MRYDTIRKSRDLPSTRVSQRYECQGYTNITVHTAVRKVRAQLMTVLSLIQKSTGELRRLICCIQFILSARGTSAAPTTTTTLLKLSEEVQQWRLEQSTELPAVAEGVILAVPHRSG